MEGRAGSEIALLRAVARGLLTPVSRAGQAQPPSECILVSLLIFCFHNLKKKNSISNLQTMELYLAWGLEAGKSKSIC